MADMAGREAERGPSGSRIRPAGLAALPLLAFVVACAPPGAPPLVDRARAGADFVPGCQNVSAAARAPLPFTTDFYLSTFASARREGASLGRYERALAGEDIPGPLPARGRIGNMPALMANPPPVPFCMVIDAPPDRVVPALSRVMSGLGVHGYRTHRSASAPPVFETSVVFRSHRAAQWADLFVAGTSPMGPGRTAVTVRRDLFISRGGGIYTQAYSVGANETWILAAVRQEVADR